MNSPRPHRSTPALRRLSARSRCGAVLVEFAFVAFAFYILLMGTVEIGRMVLTSQMLNNAARVGARELAIMPLPATMTFAQAMDMPIRTDELLAGNVIAKSALEVRSAIYDKNKLALDVTNLNPAQVQLLLDSLPSLNRMLLPLMIRERVTIGGETKDLIRYPGALVLNPEFSASEFIESESGNRFDILIPRVIGGGPDGAGSIEWVPVVEEVRPSADPAQAPFSIASTGRATLRGVVCLRINYPYQASLASAFMPSNDGTNTPIIANDSALVDNSGAGVSTVNASSSDLPSQSGRYGLGVMYAFGQEVRPYRRLISAQCIARRETMTPPPIGN